LYYIYLAVLGGSFEAFHDEIDSWCFLVRFRSFFFQWVSRENRPCYFWNMMFSNLISRWIMFRLWRHFTAATSWRTMILACNYVNGALLLTSPPVQSSNTIEMWLFPSSYTSNARMILGWSSRRCKQFYNHYIYYKLIAIDSVKLTIFTWSPVSKSFLCFSVDKTLLYQHELYQNIQTNKRPTLVEMGCIRRKDGV